MASVRTLFLPVLTALAILLTVVTQHAYALNAVADHSAVVQYRHTGWRIADGDIPDAPTALAQTADGYVWVGTGSGLLQFDGARFIRQPIAPDPKSSNGEIMSLFADPKDGLWIGTGKDVRRLSGGTLSIVHGGAGRANAIFADSKGTIWYARSRARSGGLCQVRDGEAACFGSPQLCPFGDALAEDSGGTIWVAAVDRLCTWKDGKLSDQSLAKLSIHAALQGIQAITSAADGTLLVGFEQKGPGAGLQRFADGQFQTLRLPGFDSENLDVTTLLHDRDNGFWVGTGDRGLYHIHGRTVDHIGPEDGLSGLSVQALMQDKEGNLWVATAGGLDKFSQLRVASFGAQQGLPGDDIAAVLATRSGEILASSGQGLGVISGARGRSIGRKDGLPGQIVTSFLRSKRGDLVWIGVDDILASYSNGRFLKASDTKVGPIVSMAEDASGTLWVVAASGTPVYRLFKKPIDQPIAEVTDPVTQQRVVAVRADDAGQIYFLTQYRDVWSYRNGAIQKIAGPVADATGIIFDHDSSLWISSNSGMFLHSGEGWRRLDSNNGLPCNQVQATLFDAQSNLWLHLACGYARIDHRDIEAWKKGQAESVHPMIFDGSEGARSGFSSFSPKAALAQDGTVWFATDTLLQMINPSGFHQNDVAPPVKIEELVVDRHSYPLSGSVTLPPNSQDIEIRFAALSFENPRKVVYEYGIAGVGQPVQASAERRSAIYSNLGPGSYTFHVTAANDDGVWNHQGATLTFVIPPFFYQTVWFRFLLLVVLLFTLWLVMTYRVQRAAAAVELRMGERLAERNRIARELHDTLLQGLQSFHLRFQVIADSMTKDDRSREMLLDSMSKADLMILDVRDKVRDLRNSTERTGTLGDDLHAYLDEMALSDPGLDFRLNVVGASRMLKPVVREELEAMAREAIFNAIQHASASTIVSEVRFSKQRLILSVLDDGIGMPIDVIEHGGRAGHWGLIGMRERVHKIGGNVELTSSATGTLVVITLDARHAYTDALSGTRLSMLASLLRRWH